MKTKPLPDPKLRHPSILVNASSSGYAPSVIDHHTQAWVAATALLLGLLLIFVWQLGRGQAKRQRQRDVKFRADCATRGETDGESLLQSAGYVIEARKPSLVWRLETNEGPVEFSLRPDWLVTRAGQRFVADAKTGELAPSLAHGPTRRQLLEYALAYETQGALLVDTERGRIVEVRFTARDSKRDPGWTGPLVVGLLLGISLVLLALKLLMF